MTAYSAPEQQLYDWLRSSIPSWFFAQTAVPEEIWGATVKSLQDVRAQVDDWLTAVFILTAEDIWLNQHARDRGTTRQNGETDAVLRDRLRLIDDAVTPAAVKAAVDSILAASSGGTSALVELRKDRAYFCTRISPTGTGDSFAKSGTTITLTDSGHTFTGNEVGMPVTIAGATTGANDGTYTITDVTGDHSITYVNASGAAEAYGGTWTIDSDLSGRKVAYISRGYRMGSTGRPSSLIIILPYGTSAATAAAVIEGLRLKKAAGYKSIVELRINP